MTEEHTGRAMPEDIVRAALTAWHAIAMRELEATADELDLALDALGELESALVDLGRAERDLAYVADALDRLINATLRSWSRPA